MVVHDGLFRNNQSLVNHFSFFMRKVLIIVLLLNIKLLLYGHISVLPILINLIGIFGLNFFFFSISLEILTECKNNKGKPYDHVTLCSNVVLTDCRQMSYLFQIVGKLTYSKSDWPGFKNSVCVMFATVKFMDINHLKGELYNLLRSVG